ncbi:MAG: CNNM domain-containing protein [Saprospiraceae bacterium]
MNILIVTFLVLLSGAFSGLTLGFFSLNLTSLERKAKLGDKRARKIYPVRKNGNLLLCTLLLGNVAVNSAMAIFLGELATGVVAGLVSTGLIVVFGEIIPQAVFSRFALTLGSNTVWLVRVFIFVLYPIAFPLSWLLDKALGAELATIWNKREIEEIIKHHEDAEESEIDADEERIMLGALAFSDRTAKEIMTPKNVVFMLEKEQPITLELVLKIKENGFTRIPVYQNQNRDHIIGLLLVKDLLGVDLTQNFLVKDFVKEVLLFIREEMLLDNLLNHFIKEKKHLAGVFNEFGGFQGVVSLEDIIEEILNVEILDEADKTKNLQFLAKTLIDKKLLEE